MVFEVSVERSRGGEEEYQERVDRPPRDGSRRSSTRSFGTLACRTVQSTGTSVGFDIAQLSSSCRWSGTNVLGRWLADE
jgi:hypothetical protein